VVLQGRWFNTGMIKELSRRGLISRSLCLPMLRRTRDAHEASDSPHDDVEVSSDDIWHRGSARATDPRSRANICGVYGTCALMQNGRLLSLGASLRVRRSLRSLVGMTPFKSVIH
jgi:hypothetical protein